MSSPAKPLECPAPVPPIPDPDPRVRVNLTAEHFPGFVRRDKRFPSDSEEYRQGLRVCPPREELPGDVFDRQRVIVDFDQALLEQQRCLVLGAGGVGQNVALGLARLGVRSIVLLDRDEVEASNLTRQCLVSARDVGKSKVEAAVESLLHSHNLRSRISGEHLDAVKRWSRVVQLARDSDVIFNCIDAGATWDFAVNGLAKELEVPLLQGQSYAWFCNAELFSGRRDRLCGSCSGPPRSSWQFSQIQQPQRRGLLSALQSFLSRDRGEAGQKPAGEDPNEEKNGEEQILSPERLSEFFAQEPRFRASGPKLVEVLASILREDFEGAEVLPLALKEGSETEDAQIFERFLQGWFERSAKLLLPGRVSQLSDICFLPFPKPVPTRMFGSWFAPCMMASVIMISQFTNYLTGPSGQNPPVNVSFLLDQGMTDTESFAYESGMPQNKADRPTALSPSAESCSVCKAAQDLHAPGSEQIERPLNGVHHK